MKFLGIILEYFGTFHNVGVLRVEKWDHCTIIEEIWDKTHSVICTWSVDIRGTSLTLVWVLKSFLKFSLRCWSTPDGKSDALKCGLKALMAFHHPDPLPYVWSGVGKLVTPQSAFTCSKLTIEALEQGVK